MALLIVYSHSFLIVDGNYDFVDANRLWGIFGPTLPMFFALSGFLISGSAQRLKLKDFLLNRFMRIVPALAIDILISSFIIGPIVTSYALKDYIHDQKFYTYFLNIVGFIHYLLPGVFLSNPWRAQVNGSLWTVPFEIGCYGIMSLLIITGAIKTRTRVLLGGLFFVLIFYGLELIHLSISDVIRNEVLENYASNFFQIEEIFFISIFWGAF